MFFAFQPTFAQVEVRTYYDDEKQYLKEILHVADSQSQVIIGDYVLYFLDSGVQVKGQYSEGLPTGIWEYYYENGNLKMKGALQDNTNFGKWEFYYENGKKSREGELYDGKREDQWIFYYENGLVKSQGVYKNSRSDGIWNYYYEDGELKGQAYYEIGTGTYKEFYHSGSLKVEGRNQNGKSDGLWKYYYETGELQSEGIFVEGVRMGEWKFYHKNESLAAVGNFTEGRKHGPWQYYYEDGSLSSEGFERNDQKDGFWKLYYDTGELKGEGNYKEGNGDYKEFHPSGRLKISGQLNGGLNHGRWLYYYEDGSLEGEADFRLGEGPYTGYYPDGTLKSKGYIKEEKKIGEWKLYDKNGQLAGFYKPIYEEAPPVYKTSETIEEDLERVKYDKPEYLFIKRDIRYFTPTINEYKGGIVAFNPLLTLIGQFPFSLEHYTQERLGYELQFIWIRDPFFQSKSSININKNYERGFGIKFRQKFYHREGSLGMPYFAHELAYTRITHEANILDSAGVEMVNQKISANEKRFEYGITVGSRWVRNSGNGGFTVDVFIGVGIGIRDYKRNYASNSDFDLIFNDINQSKTSVPFIFGINFGFITPKRETTVR